MDAEQVTERIAQHGEGPIWDSEQGRLLIVDIPRGEVLDLRDPSTGRVDSDDVARYHVGKVAAALRPRSAGGFVVATEHGFSLFDRRLRAAGPWGRIDQFTILLILLEAAWHGMPAGG